jgi:hypothetical protein
MLPNGAMHVHGLPKIQPVAATELHLLQQNDAVSLLVGED